MEKNQFYLNKYLQKIIMNTIPKTNLESQIGSCKWNDSLYKYNITPTEKKNETKQYKDN